MQSVEATLERQARQLRTMGLPLMILGGICACAGIYLAFAGNAETAWSCALGILMFGGLGVAAYRRSVVIRFQLAEARRDADLPVVRERR